MKRKKFLWMSATFVAGSLAGIFLMGLFSFTSPSNPPNPSPAVNTITVPQAISYFKNALRVATPCSGVINGVTLDKNDLTAMSSLLTTFPNLAGFRVYNGIDDSGAKIAIIVAIDNNGANGTDLTTTIYSATSTRMGLCPPICDQSSPITH